MSREYDPINSMIFFEKANELAVPIEDVNNRYEVLVSHPTLSEDKEPEFFGIARSGLRAEQKAAFTALTTTVPLELYSGLYEECDKTASEINELEIALDGVRAEMSDEQRRYEDLVRAVTEISPLGGDQASELAERRKSEIELSKSASLRERLSESRNHLSELERLVIESGKPWPIPRLLGENAPTIEFVDELPVDPQHLKPSERRRLDQLRERHVYAPEASKLTAFFLTENSGKIVTVDDLLEFMYSPEIIAENNKARSLVTSILGRVHGERIHDMLLNEGDGYVLQYGWRRRRDAETGQPVGPRYRIYRALNLEDIASVEEVIQYDSAVDSFDDAEAHPEIDAAELPSDCATDTETLAKVPENDTPQQAKPERVRGGWKNELKKVIGETINALEADNLMGEGGLAANIVSKRSSSQLMGTKTAIDRMVDAGVLAAPNDRAARQRMELQQRDRIIMFMFNTQSTNFTERSRRKAALALVDEAVASYNRKQAE